MKARNGGRSEGKQAGAAGRGDRSGGRPSVDLAGHGGAVDTPIELVDLSLHGNAVNHWQDEAQPQRGAKADAAGAKDKAGKSRRAD